MFPSLFKKTAPTFNTHTHQRKDTSLSVQHKLLSPYKYKHTHQRKKEEGGGRKSTQRGRREPKIREGKGEGIGSKKCIQV